MAEERTQSAEERAQESVSRRRALQVGAGVAFSAPMIKSLATTPAYATCSSTSGDFMIDDFAINVVYPGGPGAVVQGMPAPYPFDQRQIASISPTTGTAGITGGTLEWAAPAGESAPSLSYRTLRESSVGCNKIVMKDFTGNASDVSLKVVPPAPPYSDVMGAVVSGDLVFTLPAAAIVLGTTFSFSFFGGHPFTGGYCAVGGGIWAQQ